MKMFYLFIEDVVNFELKYGWDCEGFKFVLFFEYDKRGCIIFCNDGEVSYL